MNEQERTTPETSAPASPALSGITNPDADLHHGYLVDEYVKSLQTDPTGAVQRWGYAWLHSMTDEDAQAQRERWGFPANDALDYYNQGCLLAAREDFSGAAKAFARATELKPDLAEAQFNRAMAIEQAGKASDAREAWKIYLERFSDLPEDEVRLVRDRLTALADA